MENIIKAAMERGASDLHIKAGDVFRARIDGVLKPLTKQRLTPEQTKAIALQLITSEEDRKRIEEIRDYDCSWGAPGIGRFRVNILRQRSSFMVVMRAIPFEVPTFERLHLPQVLGKIADSEEGVVLVAGMTGSGKRGTIAAMIHHMNSAANRHIVTLERPIEFLHRDVQASITQREVGVDTDDFATGLRAALRQDPDVVVVGELSDVETVDIALKAAETGRMLIGAMQTPDVVTTLSHTIALFPEGERAIARLRLADTLRAVVSQRLVVRADGEGRCAVVEIMISTPKIRELIREPDRLDDIRAEILRERDMLGMQTSSQHLVDLVEAGMVTEDVAKASAVDLSELEELLAAARSGSGRSKGKKKKKA